MSGERVYRYNRRKSLTTTVFGVLLAGGCLWLAYRYADTRDRPDLVWSVAIFFAALLLLGAARTFDHYRERSPRLIVDDRGITDNAHYSSFGFVPWSDIRDVRIVTREYRHGLFGPTTRVDYIVIDVHDAGQFWRRGTTFQHMVRTRNETAFGSPMVLEPNVFDADAEDVERAIRGRLAAARSKMLDAKAI